MTPKSRLALVLLVPTLAGLALWLLWGGGVSVAPEAPSPRTTSEASGDALVGDPGPVGDALPADPGERASDAALDAPPAPTGPPPTGLRVLVTDRKGTPLAGVGVWAHPMARFRDLSRDRNERTGEDGVAVLLDLDPGRTQLTCSLGDRTEAEVRAGEVLAVTLVQRTVMRLSGRVVDSDGRGVGGAQVVLVNRYSAWLTTQPLTTTDAEGHFRDAWIDQHRLVAAVASGYGPSPLVEIETQPWTQKEVEVALILGPRGGDISGVVRTPTGEPAADVLLVQEDPRASPYEVPQRHTHTDAEGRYSFQGLAPGAHRFHATSPEHGRGIWEVEVVEGGHTQRDLLLPLGTRVSGVVRLPDGSPAVGAEVVALDVPDLTIDPVVGPHLFSRFGPSAATFTDREGRYELRGLLTGECQLYASLGSLQASILRADDPRPTFQGCARTILDLPPGAQEVWDPTLNLGREIFGRVLDADGNPVQAYVVLDHAQGNVGGRNLDDDGRFRFGGLHEPEYELSVQRYGGGPGAVLQAFMLHPSEVEQVLRLDVVQDRGVRVGTVRFEWRDRASEIEGKRYGFDYAQGNRRGFQATSVDAVTTQLNPSTWVPVAYVGETLVFEGDPFELRDGEVVDLGPIEVPPPGKLVVDLILPEGHSGSVRLEHRPRYQRGEVVVVSPGVRRWEFPVLPSGDQVLLASSEGLATTWVSLEVAPGETREARVVLRRGASVQLRFDADRRSTGDTLHAELLTEDGKLQGTWSMVHGIAHPWGRPFERVLAPGDYELHARTDDGRSGITKFTVGVGPDGEPVAPEGVVEVIAR